MSRSLIAEFLGTFTLVFIGSLAVAVTGFQQANANVVVPALAHSLVLVGLIFAYGSISGGHFNPAVTVGMLVGGKIALPRGLLYIVVQFTAACVATALLIAILPDRTNYGATIGVITDNNGSINAAILEAVLVFLLVTTIYQTAVHGRAGNLAPIAIGFTLGACILAAGYYTGASLNPARTFGPWLVPVVMDGQTLGAYGIPYFIAHFIGGAVGGLVNTALLNKD